MPVTIQETDELVGAILDSLTWAELKGIALRRFRINLSDALYARAGFRGAATKWVALLESRALTADFILVLWAERSENPRVRALHKALTAPTPTFTPTPAPPAATALVAAFMGAFGFDTLVKLAADALKVDLNTLAPRGSTVDAIFALVNYAEANNRISELFAAARDIRPHNPHLAPTTTGAVATASQPPPAPPARVQRKQFRKLLLDQFPKDSDLAILLDDSLGEPLAKVVTDGKDADDLRHKLIIWLWVDHASRLRPFLAEAVDCRPGCAELKSLFEQLSAA